MYDIVRDSPLGQCIRILTCGRIFKYPEETADFTLPLLYQSPVGSKATADRFTGNDLEASHGDARSDSANSPLRTQDGITIVTWYSPDDPENPYNWTPGKKLWVGILLFIYTFAVYIGSSLYTASEPDIVKIYHVSDIAASIGLTLYVLGYGIGPMLFSPLSEIPVIGRNSIYIITFVIFTVLCVPMALVDNFAGILVLRFLLGFFGSPCLATAGASYGDFYGPTQLPYVIAMWGGGATLGPALGPLVGGFAVQEMTWRWSSWELLWLSAPIMILMFCTMPETSSDKILLRRAQRLRLLTGREDLKSESETRQEKMNPREIAFFALIKPWQINALDPAVLFSTFYTGLTYGIYYSFFECFPMVYNDMYGFNLGQLGLAFLSVLVGLFVAVVLLCAYLYFIAPKRLGRFEPAGVPPEERIWPGLFATFLIPLGLYLFAWTANPSIHWIVSLIGIAISMCGVFIITQCMFIYLPFTYPRYAGSLFAANGLARSIFAGAAILFSRPMFERLRVSGGVTLLASMSVLCSGGMFGLYFGGGWLRKRSRFAEK